MAAEGKLCHLPVNDSHFIPTARPSVDVGNSAGGQGAAGETGRQDADRRCLLGTEAAVCGLHSLLYLLIEKKNARASLLEDTRGYSGS